VTTLSGKAAIVRQRKCHFSSMTCPVSKISNVKFELSRAAAKLPRITRSMWLSTHYK